MTSNNNVGRCTGHCCNVIRIDQSPKMLEARVLKGGRQGSEAAQLIQILNHTGTCDGGRSTYRCTKLLSNGDCGIYTTRPLMCKDYPYGTRCYVDGCTMSVANQLSTPYSYEVNHDDDDTRQVTTVSELELSRQEAGDQV